ncbi:MAG: hypothetical protein R3E18_11370 [Sphingomonadaceae bacterium]|nr:hypothetical protein [Sphingomonadaceae bacterium]
MAGKSKAKPNKKAALSSHRAFPAIVALWFATLLGFGSLVLPAILFEKLVTVTGIASFLPAAAPPLGAKARMLIAVVAGLIGIIAGLLVARKVASAQAPAAPMRKNSPALRRADRHDDAPAKRPISAREELGSDSLDDDIEDEWGEPSSSRGNAGRRRPLAMAEEVGRSEYLAMVPLPGGDSQTIPMQDQFAAEDAPAEPVGVDFAAAAEVLDVPEEEALELNNFAAPEPTPVSADSAAPFAPPAPQPEFAATDVAPAYLEPAFAHAAAEPAMPPHNVAIPQALVEISTEPDSSADGGEEEVFMNNQPDSDANPSQGEHYNPFGDHIAEPEAEPAASSFVAEPYAPQPQAYSPLGAIAFAAARPVAPAPQPVPETFAPAPAAAATVAEHEQVRPLGELGMAELVARFAQSLERQKANPEAGSTAAAAPLQPPMAAPMAPATEADAAEMPLELPAFAARAAAPAPFSMPVSPPPASPVSAPAMPAAFADPLGGLEPTEPAPAPVPAAQPVTAPAADVVPAAFRPFALDDDDMEDDGPDLSLRLNVSALRPFSAPAAPAMEAKPAMPAAFADPVAAAQEQPLELDVEEDSEYAEDYSEEDSGYSSLLDMKRPLGSGREAVRIDDDVQGDGPVEPVVIFPGQDNRRAAPAADGPSRDPAEFSPATTSMPAVQPNSGPRPFDAPGANKVTGAASGSFGSNASALPAVNQTETERALREALEKLNRMSGAA